MTKCLKIVYQHCWQEIKFFTLLSMLISAPFFNTTEITSTWTSSSKGILPQRTWSIVAPYIHYHIKLTIWNDYIDLIWSHAISNPNRQRVQERQLVHGDIRKRVYGCGEAPHVPGHRHIVKLQSHHRVKRNRFIQFIVEFDNYDVFSKTL